MMVTLFFAMQAAGLIVGPLFASALLSTSLSHDIIWRILIAFGAVPTLAVFWQRRKLKESPRFLHANGMQEDESGKVVRIDGSVQPSHSVSFWDGFHRLVNDDKLLLRLIGASAAWFLMDAAYYGNTVSSPLVLSALQGHHSLLQKTLTRLSIFAVFAAPGYAVAAFAMDRLGRKFIQCLGFAMMVVTFGLTALIPNIEKMVVPFVLIYGTSFFFTEFGPNATTYLMHWKGLPAVETAAAIASAIGLLVTIFLLPETKGKSLEEL